MDVHDLSERKDLEEFLLLAEEQFSTAFYLSPAPMVVTYPETGRIVKVNKAFEADSGYAGSELIGHNASEFNFWNSAEERGRFIKTLTENGRAEHSEMRVQVKSGEHRDVFTSSALIRINGKPHILSHIQDITLQKQNVEKNMTCRDRLESTISEREAERQQAEREVSSYRDRLEELVRERTTELVERNALLQKEISERRKAEEALRESEEKYRLVVENANEAIVVIQDGVFRFVSVKGLSGYTQEELISIPLTTLIHPEDSAMVMENHKRRINGESLPSVYVFRIIDKEGNTKWLEINSVMVSWNGRPASLSFFSDVSDRIKANEEKKKLENQILQVQKMDALGRFAGGIAHDLNNLLYPVMLDIEMLLEKMQPGDESLEVLNQVLKAAYRQRDLVKQILSFSRRDTQKFVAVQISPLLRETLGFIRASLPSTIEICRRINCPYDSVLGDPVQIQQVIMNLCRNAADAMDSLKGTIEVGLENTCLEADPAQPEIKEGRYVRLAVKDSGCGMTKDVTDMVFEPFFTTKEKGKGIGIGLSIVHGFLKSHGGTVTVESEPGKGSLFSVYLPLYSEKSAEILSPASGAAPGGSEKILLIDDEEIILSSLERVFTKSGYQVVAIQDSREALRIFTEGPKEFDLVITDLSMPKMTGIELTRKILDIRPDIPVILCTGYNEDLSGQEARSLGIRELLLKPASSNELKMIVRRALEQ